MVDLRGMSYSAAQIRRKIPGQFPMMHTIHGMPRDFLWAGMWAVTPAASLAEKKNAGMWAGMPSGVPPP